MELNEFQKKHYDSVMWLLDSRLYVREGRTLLMAQCFIDIACIHRNQPVHFIDHYPLAEKVCKNYMKDIILELLRAEHYKDTKFKITNTYLMIK